MNDVILMVEDNPDDAHRVQSHLQHSELKRELRVVPDGLEAIDYLSRASRQQSLSSFRLPCLLIIDLKVPNMDGFALIEWVRQNPQLKQIPIIVYSGSASPEDIERAYALGADAYLAKLTGPGQYNLLFNAIQEFCD
jgi:CheY-like chemotaxis protein